jgi:SsrA-binding protein
LDTFEGGLVLRGSEVKSLRDGKASLVGAFAHVRGSEVWLEGLNIAPYDKAGYSNHDPLRGRKLLLHKREIRRLIGAVTREGRTLIPLELYFTPRGLAKVTLALARGKQLHDKREDLKRRAEEREVARAFRERRR